MLQFTAILTQIYIIKPLYSNLPNKEIEKNIYIKIKLCYNISIREKINWREINAEYI